MTAARTRMSQGVTTVRDNLGRRQISGRRNPFARVGAVLTWTEHRVALLTQRFGPALYDKRLLGATRCLRYSLGRTAISPPSWAISLWTHRQVYACACQLRRLRHTFFAEWTRRWY